MEFCYRIFKWYSMVAIFIEAFIDTFFFFINLTDSFFIHNVILLPANRLVSGIVSSLPKESDALVL